MKYCINLRNVSSLLDLCRGKYQCLRRRLHLSTYLQSAPKNAEHKKLPFEVNTNVKKDVLLFKLERPYFMQFLSGCGVFFTLGSAGSFLYLITCTRDPEPNVYDEETWWKNNMFWRNKNRFILTALSVLFGCVIGYAMYAYPAHSIRQVWLLKGGEKVRMYTYGPFASSKEKTIPLENICCMGRSKDAQDIFVKVKGDKLHYIIDTKGSFPYPNLFDQTVGIHRKHYKI